MGHPRPGVRHGSCSRPWTASPSRPGVIRRRQGPPQGIRRRAGVLLAHRHLRLDGLAHPLHQHPPHQALTHLRAARPQRSLTLSFGEDLAHQRPHRTVVPRRPGCLRVPMQEREAEEADVLKRPADQLPPEAVEGVAEVRSRRPTLPLELPARHRAQRALGEVPYRQGQALLAAMLPVQRAHRHMHRPRQLRGPHVVVAPLRQQHRHAPHVVGVGLLHYPHAPAPSAPSGAARAWNERSFRLPLPTGRV